MNTLTSIPTLTGSDVAVVISSLDFNIDQSYIPISTEATPPQLPIIRQKPVNDLLYRNQTKNVHEVVLPDFISVETRFITQAAAAHAHIDLSSPDILTTIPSSSKKDKLLKPIRPCGPPSSLNPKPIRLMQKPINVTNFAPSVATTNLPFSAAPKSKDDIFMQQQSPPPMVLLGSAATPLNKSINTSEQLLKKKLTTINYLTPSTSSCTNNNKFSTNNLISLETTKLNNTTNFTTPSQPLKSYVDCSVITDGPNPTRDRGIQIDFRKSVGVEIGIQCSLELDEFEEWSTEAKNQNKMDDENVKVKESFLKFVTKNVYEYVNGRVECLICGEIKLNKNLIQNHMAQHWGPTALCWLCGIEFENKILLKNHSCQMKKKNQKSNNSANCLSLKCPHYRCGVVAISQLELYDHINEHMDMPLYECSGCERNFYTAGELRHHLTLRIECLEALKQRLPYHIGKTAKDKCYRLRIFNIHSQKSKFVLVKSFLSLRTKSKELSKKQRCQICLKTCTNKFQFSRHTKRCLKGYLNRMERKRKFHIQ